MNIKLYPMSVSRGEHTIIKNIRSLYMSLVSSTTPKSRDLHAIDFNFIPTQYYYKMLNNVLKVGACELMIWSDIYRSLKRFTYDNKDEYGIFFSFEVEGTYKFTVRGIDFPMALKGNKIPIGDFSWTAFREISYNIDTFISRLSTFGNISKEYLLQNIHPFHCDQVYGNTKITFFIRLPMWFYYGTISGDLRSNALPLSVIYRENTLLEQKHVDKAVKFIKDGLVEAIDIALEKNSFEYKLEKDGKEVNEADFDTTLVITFKCYHQSDTSASAYFLSTYHIEIKRCGIFEGKLGLESKIEVRFLFGDFLGLIGEML